MDRESQISYALEKFNLSLDEVKAHFDAYYQLSEYSNKKPLDAIPEEKRYRIAQFYKYLRLNNILFYNPNTGKSQENVDYYEGWVRLLKNNPDMPEMQDVTIDQVKKMIANSLEEVKKRMYFRNRKPIGNVGPNLSPKDLKEKLPF